MAPDDVTRILKDAEAGDGHAIERLFPVVYDELRQIAESHMRRERPEHTLQATALVHEAYARLMDDENADWSSRAYFFTAAAEAMRRILIEHARSRARLKRGGGRKRLPLSVCDLADDSVDPDSILALDDALRRLEEEDARTAQVVRLRFFEGMTISEIAELCEITREAVSSAIYRGILALKKKLPDIWREGE